MADQDRTWQSHILQATISVTHLKSFYIVYDRRPPPSLHMETVLNPTEYKRKSGYTMRNLMLALTAEITPVIVSSLLG